MYVCVCVRAYIYMKTTDPAAADGEVMWVPMVNLTGYGVNITSIMYGGKELLELGPRGLPAGGTMGIFDTGKP